MKLVSVPQEAPLYSMRIAGYIFIVSVLRLVE